MAPIDGIRFVHAAIVNETRDIEREAHVAATPEAAGALLPRLEFCAELIDGHTTGEELGLFPPLVAREPNFADTGAEYLDELLAVMPPEVFNGTKASVRDAVGPQHWSDLVERLPTLS